MTDCGRPAPIDTLLAARCWLRQSECHDFSMHLPRAEKNLQLDSIGMEVRRRRESLGLTQTVHAAKRGFMTK